MKRTALVAGALALALLFAACSRIPAAETAPVSPSAAPVQTTPPEQTAAPTTAPTPSPTTEPGPAAAIAVGYESSVVTVTGKDASGAALWSRTFPIAEETELQPWSEATLDGAVAYLQVDYHMLALETATGKTLWTSDASGGLCKPVVFEGVVYTCSYYGDPLIGISTEDGFSIFAVEPFKDYIWPYAVELSGDKLTVRFGSTGGDNDQKGSATFNLAGELLGKKAD